MQNNPPVCRIGIITVSDRASRGEYDDLSTPEIKRLLNQYLRTQPEYHAEIVPDETGQIEKQIIHMADRIECHMILTTGGTGPAPRDVTPDATKNVCPRILEGFGEKMRTISLKYVPTAILSRQVGAIRKKSLVINLPGQPKSIRQILEELFEVIPYTVELISGYVMRTNNEHVTPFRPASAKKIPPN